MTAKDILADNLKRLIEHHQKLKLACRSQNALARETERLERLGMGTKVAQTTISAIIRKDAAAGIDVLETLAKAFGLSAYQLLIPKLPVANPPAVLTNEVRAFLRRASAIAHELDSNGGLSEPVEEPPIPVPPDRPHGDRKSKGQRKKHLPRKH